MFYFNKKSVIKNKEKESLTGFGLLKLIIYIAIIGVVLILASGFAWNIIHGDIKALAWREVQQNARFAMEKITRSIRNGQDPLTVFSLSDNILYQNGVALTTETVLVTDLQFTLVDNGYKINLSVEYYNPEMRPEREASISWETTSVTRNP